MITISPQLNNNQNVDNNTVKLIAKENETFLGYIELYINKNKYVEIYNLYIENFNEQDLLDSIVKAAMAYALNRNIFTITCKNQDLFATLNKFGFNEKSGILYLDLFKTLKPCEQL